MQRDLTRVALALAERWPLPVLVRRATRGVGTADVGRLGEALAARALARSGLRIRARRLRTSAGEIDLVLDDGAGLVACEVKSALAVPPDQDAPDLFRPGRHLSARQLARQRRAARKLDPRAGRVDLVEVWIAPETGRVRIDYHVDVRFGGPSTAARHSSLESSHLGTFQVRNPLPSPLHAQDARGADYMCGTVQAGGRPGRSLE